MVQTWMSDFIRRYGEPAPPYDDLSPTTLLAYGTMRMVNNYFYKMKEQLVNNPLGSSGRWTFVCQLPDLNALKEFLKDKTTVSLMGSKDAPYFDEDDDDVTDCRSTEFLFTFIIMRGKDQVSYKMVSRIPRDINKVVSGPSKACMVRAQQNSQEFERRQGKQILSNRAAFRAAKGQCNMCGVSENTSTCSGCRKVYYCSKAHQKDDWPYHKVFCKIHQGVMDKKSASEICKEENFTETDKEMSLVEGQIKKMSLKDVMQSLNQTDGNLNIIHIDPDDPDNCNVVNMRR